MQDIVFPQGNEQDFITLAKRLGFTGLVFVYKNKSDFSKNLFARNALLVKPEAVKGAKLAKILTVCTASREALERGADIVFGFETTYGKDKTHYRESGLNQVLCRIATDQGTRIGFCAEAILEASGQARTTLLGRLMQNIFLCRKFKTPVCIASFATKPENMRAPAELVPLFKDLGMDIGTAKSALN